MINRTMATYADIGKLSESPRLARAELLDFTARSVEQYVLKAYDENFDDLVLYLASVATQIRTMSEKALSEYFRDN